MTGPASASAGLPLAQPRAARQTRWHRLLRRPLLHFLLLGGLLFVAQQWLPRPAQTLHVGAADVDRLREDWRRDTGRSPTAAELRASLDRWLQDEALLREALRLGLDQRDAVAQRRLLMNLRFAFPDAPEDDAGLLREAEALEMQQSDLVARRRLIQAMEQRLLGEIRWSEQELRDYVAAHPERYAAPLRYRFRHVFLEPSRRDQAAALLVSLREQPVPPQPAGDPFLLGERFDSLTREEIARLLGPALATAVAEAEPGQWQGPVDSPYGRHLVHVEAREPPPPPDYATLRQQAAYALLAEREAQWLAQARRQLLQRFRIDAEPGVWPEAAP